MKQIDIRPATVDDAAFIAQCVLAAVDVYHFEGTPDGFAETTECCAREDTLFSYRNTRVACDGDVAVGCMISYDGAIYQTSRRLTFSMLGMPQSYDMETGSGEYYLDAMAIIPEYRGYGIGHILMKDALALARERGFRKAALIVEKGKTGLQKYYADLGFRVAGQLSAFNEEFFKMTLDL